MNIVMFTNAYDPVIGGLERSIVTFADDMRRAGHAVLIVTLEFPGAEESSEHVFRLPAVTEVRGTEFSFKLPVPAGLKSRLDDFVPDIVHSHHPFMLGDTALRVARSRGLPLVFTHHTLYERYAYVFSRDSQTLERMAMAVATEYANLCSLVVAPTRSIEQLIRQRGVRVPIQVIPTGIDVELFSHGRRREFRSKHGIPPDAFVVGYLGRMVEAKNMEFVARAAVRFLSEKADAWFLVAGEGDAEERVRRLVQDGGVADRVVLTGSLNGQAVADAYAAMDLFAFASKTETQGIVLIEALCAGVPVVALDAPGTRDIVQNGSSGVVMAGDASPEAFARELCELKDQPAAREHLCAGARERAGEFDRVRCAERLLSAYTQVMERSPPPPHDEDAWWSVQERFSTEWSLIKEKLYVMAAALGSETTIPPSPGGAAESSTDVVAPPPDGLA